MDIKPFPLSTIGGNSLAFNSDFEPDLTFLLGKWMRQFVVDSDVSYALTFFPPDLSSAQKLTSAQLRQCKQDLEVLLKTAGKPNWDGEGADPVTEDAVKIAKEVIDDLPGDSGVPEISADPEGNVEFDWHLDNGTMLTVCIGQTGEIAISGLYPQKAKLTIAAEDSEGVPSILRCGLEWLSEMKSR